ALSYPPYQTRPIAIPVRAVYRWGKRFCAKDFNHECPQKTPIEKKLVPIRHEARPSRHRRSGSFFDRPHALRTGRRRRSPAPERAPGRGPERQSRMVPPLHAAGRRCYWCRSRHAVCAGYRRAGPQHHSRYSHRCERQSDPNIRMGCQSPLDRNLRGLIFLSPANCHSASCRTSGFQRFRKRVLARSKTLKLQNGRPWHKRANFIHRRTSMKAPFLIGRILFGGFFLYNGINHFKNRGQMAQYAASKGVPQADAAVAATGALLVFGGASIITGILPKLGTAAIAVFLG